MGLLAGAVATFLGVVIGTIAGYRGGWLDELLMGITNTMPGVAHFAHLGGMLFGWLLIRYWRGQPPFGRKGPPRMRVVR